MLTITAPVRFGYAAGVDSVGEAEGVWHPAGVQTKCSLLSGGLRCASTTGYYLAALQAEIPGLSTLSGSPLG